MIVWVTTQVTKHTELTWREQSYDDCMGMHLLWILLLDCKLGVWKLLFLPMEYTIAIKWCPLLIFFIMPMMNAIFDVQLEQLCGNFVGNEGFTCTWLGYQTSPTRLYLFIFILVHILPRIFVVVRILHSTSIPFSCTLSLVSLFWCLICLWTTRRLHYVQMMIS